MPAKSQQQQKIMALALAYKRGEVPASKVSAKVKEMSKSMTEKELEKYASTKHKGLPRKVVKESSGLSTFEQFIKENEEEIEVDMDMDMDMENEGGEDTEIIHVNSGSPMKSIGRINGSPEAHEPESKMMQYQLKNIIENAEELIQMIEGMDQIEDWMQSKVTLADDYISTLRDYVKHRS
jgi:hypothetical protein